MTLSCPLFKKKLSILDSTLVQDDPMDPDSVAHLLFQSVETLEYSSPFDWITKMKSLIDSRSPLLPERLEWVDSVSPLPESTPLSFLQKDTAPFKDDSVHLNGGYFSMSSTRIEHSGLPFSVELQAILESIQKQLENVGKKMKDIVLIHVYIQEMHQFDQLNAIYGSFFGQNPPCRVTVQLPLQTCQVQLDVIGYDGSPIFQDRLHVQGISHWAPANIGPYSQSIRVLDHVYYSGQIGLIPSQMVLPYPSMPHYPSSNGQIIAEIAYSLSSLVNIVKTMEGEEDSVGCIGYLTLHEHIPLAKAAWDSLGQTCPILFVVVSGLPKGALIEWELMTGHSKSRLEMNRIMEESDDAFEPLSPSAIYSKGNVKAKRTGEFIVSLGLCRLDSLSSVELFQDKVSSLLQELEVSLITLVSQGWNHVTNVRLFHHSDIPSNLIESLSRKCLAQKSISISSVPVVSIQGNHGIAIMLSSSFASLK